MVPRFNQIKSVRTSFILAVGTIHTFLASLLIVSLVFYINTSDLDDTFGRTFDDVRSITEMQNHIKQLSIYIRSDSVGANTKILADQLIQDIDILFGDFSEEISSHPVHNKLLGAAKTDWELFKVLFNSTKEAMIKQGKFSIEYLHQLGSKSTAIIDTLDNIHHRLLENIKQDYSKAIQAKSNISLLMVLITLFGLLIAASACLMLSRTIISPINALREDIAHFDSGDINYRVKNIGDGELGEIAKTINHLAEMLASSHSHIREKSIHDSLTGLINRREFNHRLETELARAQRYNQPFALLLADVDNFKAINQENGHLAGDKVLRVLAVTLSREVRPIDTVARYGNDLFIIIIPDIGVDDALITAHRLRKTVEDPNIFLRNGKSINLTISIGLVVCPDDGSDLETLLAHVEDAVNKAKNEGSNSVHQFSGSN